MGRAKDISEVSVDCVWAGCGCRKCFAFVLHLQFRNRVHSSETMLLQICQFKSSYCACVCSSSHDLISCNFFFKYANIRWSFEDFVLQAYHFQFFWPSHKYEVPSERTLPNALKYYGSNTSIVLEQCYRYQKSFDPYTRFVFLGHVFDAF